MIFSASKEDMQQYAQLIAALTQADLQRQQCIDAIAAWEKAHVVPDTTGEETAPGSPEEPAPETY